MTTTITVSNLKGGSGKTTSAAYLAHAAENAGLRVLAVDADPQASLLEWSRTAGWTLPVIGLAIASLDRELMGIAGPGYDVIVIDTPPQGTGGIAQAAMRAADLIVLPVAPTTSEVSRVKATYAAVQEAGALAPVHVLLNRCVARAVSTGDARAVLAGNGRHVLQAEIPRLEALAQAHGGQVESSRGYNGYMAAILELVK